MIPGTYIYVPGDTLHNESKLFFSGVIPDITPLVLLCIHIANYFFLSHDYAKKKRKWIRVPVLLPLSVLCLVFLRVVILHGLRVCFETSALLRCACVRSQTKQVIREIFRSNSNSQTKLDHLEILLFINTCTYFMTS